MPKRVFNIEEFFAYLQNNELLTDNKNLIKMHRIFLHWMYKDKIGYDQLKGVVEDITKIVGESSFISLSLNEAGKYINKNPERNVYQLDSVTIDTDLITKKGSDLTAEKGMKSVW